MSCTGELVMAVLADPGHGRRLGSVFAGLVGEPDLVSDGGHGRIEHAVVVEVDLPAVCVEVSPLAFDVDVRDAAVLGLDVGLHVRAQAASVILELPARGAERIPDRDVEILVCAVERMVASPSPLPNRSRGRERSTRTPSPSSNRSLPVSSPR